MGKTKVFRCLGVLVLATIFCTGLTFWDGIQYAAAAEKFEEALSLDEHDEISSSYLELSRERMRTTDSGPNPKPAWLMRIPPPARR